VTWCLDQRRRYRDEEGDDCAIVTRWNIAPTALLTRFDNAMLAARTAGRVAQYQGDTDEGSTFRFIYQSPWLDLGEEIGNRLKMLKRLGGILFVANQTSIIFKWATDFDQAFDQITVLVPGDSGAEYNISEYDPAGTGGTPAALLGEFGGGLSLRILKLAARGTGQYFRMAIEADVTGEFAIQQAELFTKIGRLA